MGSVTSSGLADAKAGQDVRRACGEHLLFLGCGDTDGLEAGHVAVRGVGDAAGWLARRRRYGSLMTVIVPHGLREGTALGGRRRTGTKVPAPGWPRGAPEVDARVSPSGDGIRLAQEFADL